MRPQGVIERLRPLFRAPVACAVATVVMLLAALDARAICIDRSDALANWEVWRLWSGHLLHASSTHLVLNLLLFLPLAILRENRVGTRKFAAELFLLGLAVAVGVRIMHPEWHTYQGLSGVVYGLVALVLLRPPVRVPALLVVLALVLKSFGELQGGGWLIESSSLSDLYGVRYLAGSHCAGIVAGCLLAVRWPVRKQRPLEVAVSSS